jgi:hypothetical protein
VTITAGSDYSLDNASVSAPFYSRNLCPQGFPGWFNYSASVTGFSSNPTGNVYRFFIAGNNVTVGIRQTNPGTSNSGTFTISAPVTSANISGMLWIGTAQISDGGVAAIGGIFVNTNSSSLQGLSKAGTASGWLATGGKGIYIGNVTYQF